MNIPEAICCVLSSHSEGLTAKKITEEIQAQNLYQFLTVDPRSVVGRALLRHCKGVDKSYSSYEKYFIREKTDSGEFIFKNTETASVLVSQAAGSFSFPSVQVKKINEAESNTGNDVEMEAKNQTIRSLLDHYCFTVPAYQRYYSWKSIQINEFLDDVYNIVHGVTSQHFLGAMTIVPNHAKSKTMDLIDGQQRMTTIFIFLYVILAEYKSTRFADKASARANELNRKLANLNDDGDPIGSRLILGEFNQSFFKEYIVEGYAKSEEARESIAATYRSMHKFSQNEAIYNAYHQIRFSIEERLDSCANDQDAYDYLKALHKALFDYMEVVTMIVNDEADAFLIFETLNDRGLALSAVDLIKNKLFQCCASSSSTFDYIKKYWEDMCDHIDDKDDLQKFLLHYWRSQIKYTTKSNLYKTCRDYIAGHSIPEAASLAKALCDDSVYYNGFCNPKGAYPWTNAKLKETLSVMRSLNYDLLHPILLSTLHKYDKDEDKLAIAARLSLNFMIRYVSILGGKPTAIEKDISLWAQDPQFSIEFISAKFAEYAPDNEFRERLLSYAPSYSATLTHYMLCVYEAEGCGRKEVWTSSGRSDNTVEHILPQKVAAGNPDGDYWIAQFGSIEACAMYESRMGNYAFLTKKAQGKASNKRFNEKKIVYKNESDMKLTQELASYADWNPKAIEKRQKKMVDVWVKHIGFSIT